MTPSLNMDTSKQNVQRIEAVAFHLPHVIYQNEKNNRHDSKIFH